MHKTLIRILLPAAALAASASLPAAHAMRCEARLSGAQEIPAPGVDTEASGRMVARFDAALSQVDVRLRLRGLPDASRAHFHCARPGANGPVHLGLVDPGPLMFDAKGVRGTLLNEDFNPAADCATSAGRPVNNIAALAFAMRDGLVYINVHSPGHPGGEIRGQMICSSNDDRRAKRRDHDSKDSKDSKDSDDSDDSDSK